ncbi:MAG: hypothetical protein ACI8T6_000500 [Candidatus Poseidoniaceae archaeon]|jgi:hypothetical protein
MLSYVPIYFYKENVKLLLYLYVSVCISMGTHEYSPQQAHVQLWSIHMGPKVDPCDHTVLIVSLHEKLSTPNGFFEFISAISASASSICFLNSTS